MGILVQKEVLFYGEMLLRLLLAVLCGVLIGAERVKTGHPAGMRTHVLLCLGAALTMVANLFIITDSGTGDPTRMAANVVSGIGFLGAGTILVTGRKQIKGLTTAASLWASACLSLAIGCGFYKAALTGCFLILLANGLLYRLKNPLHDSARVIIVYAELKDVRAIRRFLECAREQDIRVSDMELHKEKALEGISVSVTALLLLSKHMDHQKLHQEMEQVSGVEYLEFR